MGKLFVETSRRVKVESFGSLGSASSRAARSERRAVRQAVGRAEEISCGAELRMRVSGAEKLEEHEAVVCVRRSDWARVTEREELVGRLRVVLRLPQYLDVISRGIIAFELCTLYDRDVDRCGRARPVNLLIRHCSQ